MRPRARTPTTNHIVFTPTPTSTPTHPDTPMHTCARFHSHPHLYPDTPMHTCARVSLQVRTMAGAERGAGAHHAAAAEVPRGRCAGERNAARSTLPPLPSAGCVLPVPHSKGLNSVEHMIDVTHTHIHAHTHTHMSTHTHARTHVRARTYALAHIRTHAHTHARASTHTHARSHARAYNNANNNTT